MPKPLYQSDTYQTGAGQARGHRRIERRSSGPWHYVDAPGEPAFQNGWGNIGGGKAAMAFRWNLSGGTDLQGSINNGPPGTVAFTLPEPYRPGAEVHLASSDDQGNFLVCIVQANGDVIFGVAP